MAITLSQDDIKAVAAEVVRQIRPMLGKPELVGPVGLDPDRVRYEDSQLLDAERTMPKAEYIVYHANIMAARLECQGNYTSAARIRKLAISKASRLAREAA